jgi:ribonuclease P protein component
MRERAVYTSLRRRADFSRAHSRGRRKGDALLQVRVLSRPSSDPDEPPVRLGIIVSKKFGSAVERNRFKRIVRSAIRALGPELTPGWDILVLPREAHEAKMPDILASLRRLLGELGVLRAETTPSTD